MSMEENNSESFGLIIDSNRELAQAIKRYLGNNNDIYNEDILSINDITSYIRDNRTKYNVLYINMNLEIKNKNPSYFYDGVDLLYSIKLEKDLINCFIIDTYAYSSESFEYLIKNSLNNIIIASPNTVFAHLPQQLNKLKYNHNKFQYDASKFKSSLKPYIFFSESEKRTFEHAYRNRIGVGKFIKEFAGDVIKNTNAINKDYNSTTHTEIWLKKMIFLKPEIVDVVPHKWTSFYNFRKKLNKKKKIIYIDDEHNRGWSLGLYAGLFGTLPGNIDKKDVVILQNNTGSSLTCISTFDSANQYINNLINDISDFENETIIEEIPDLFLIDLRLQIPADENLPVYECSGFKLLKTIEDKISCVPTVLITASDKATAILSAEQCGTEGYWIKGISTGGEMKNIINRCINISKLKNIWFLINKTKRKKEILVYQYRNGYSPYRLLSSDKKRIEIEKYLEISLGLLRKGIFKNKKEYYAQVVLNMGIVQELIYDRENIPLNTNIYSLLPNDEEKHFRKIRNNAAHGLKIIEPLNAIEFMEWVISILLR